MLLSNIKDIRDGRILTEDSDFVESEHPRDEDGKFGEKGIGKKAAQKTTSKKDYTSPEAKPAIMTIFKDVPGTVKMEAKKSGVRESESLISAKAPGLKFSATIDSKTKDFFIDEVHISKTRQGLGIGKNIIKNTVAFAKEQGLSSISLWAAEKAGIYAWAKLGFDYATPSGLGNAKEALEGFCKDHRVILTKDQMDQIKTAKNVAEFKVPGKQVKGMEFGKAFMLDSHGSWSGVLKI
jgi:GNAT superfamily N-acetyltransferase